MSRVGHFLRVEAAAVRLSSLMALVLAIGAAAGAGRAAADDRGLFARSIYTGEPTFSSALDEETRWFGAEVVAGLGAEGNLAAGFGLILPQLHGLELWAHFGLEANPALRYSGSLRYVFEFGDFRPFLGVGFSFADLYAQGSVSTHFYAEVGHQFALSSTYRVSASLGFRTVLDVWLKANSPLLDGTTDLAWVDEQLVEARGAFITLTLRFSRRF